MKQGKYNNYSEYQKNILVRINDQPKYRIPKQLATIVAQNKEERKALDTFITIKAFTDEPRFSDTPEQIRIFAKLNRRHPKTIVARLKWLCKNGLCVHEAGYYQLVSWQTLCQQYGILPRYYFFRSDSIFFTQNKGYIEHVLEAKTVAEASARQKSAYKYKAERTPGYKEAIENTIGTQMSQAVFNSQLHLFTSGNTNNSDEAFFIRQLRADFSNNYTSLTKMFGLTGLGSIAYKKRKLQSLGLWSIQKRVYECASIKNKNRNCILGQVRYSRLHGCVVLTLPDQIEEMNINFLLEKN